MVKKYILFISFMAFFICFTSKAALATNSGIITSITFSGHHAPSHIDIVQITLEGGFSSPGCSTTFAAIRKEEKGLLAFAIAAYIQQIPVLVVLNRNDYYFGDRCTISQMTATRLKNL